MNREVREITGVGDWLTWRAADMTASRVAALFDAHPYMTRDQLADTMRGRSQGSNAAMRAGRILEPGVIVALAEENPSWRMTKATTYHRLPDHRLGATPDYWLNDDGLIQLKTVSPDVWDKWRGHPPLGYSLQTLCELLVTGRARGVLAVMVMTPSYPLHLFEVQRHDGAEQRILDAVAEWWRAWGAGEIAGPAPVAEIAAALDDGSFVDLSENNQIREVLEERERLKAVVKDASKRIGDLEYTIKNTIGPARTAYVPGWHLSFASQNRKEHIVPAATIRVLRCKRTIEGQE